MGEEFVTVIWCALIFTIATSATYLVNDIIDMPKDRVHPIKKFRPIASGKLPIPIALFTAIVAIFLALYLGYMHSFFFFITILGYLALQIFYSFYLKNLVILDILIIAAGFIIRVYAGAFAINVHMNVWFLLCVVSLALFLAAGKRRAELAVLTEQPANLRRKTLFFYTPDTLDSYLAMFSNAAWMSYALFTFFAPPPLIATNPMWTTLPLALAGINKWLMITVPVVVYGIMRYTMIIYQGSRAEAPERVLLSDKPLLISAMIWGLLVVFILYGINPV